MKSVAALILLTSLLSFPVRAADTPAPVTLTIHAGDEPEAMDPHKVSTVIASNLTLQVFEGLVAFHPTNVAVVPGVAKEWKVEGNGSVYTFLLRQDAKWSDGTKLTAKDFEYGWLRSLDPKTANPQASRFDYIKNCKKFYNGEIKDPKQLGFKAIDDYTFRVELEAPFPPVLELLATPTFAPVKKAAIDAYGDTWSRPENMISNGAYKLAVWNVKDRIVFEKNPHYWDAKNVAVERVNALMVEDLETALKQYMSGEIEFDYHIPEAKVPVLAGRPDYRSDPTFGLYYYPVNTKHPVLQDARIRKALAYAIDRKTLVDKVVRTGEFPATGYIPHGIAGYPYKNLLTYDPAKAKKLLAEAGYPDGKGFPQITLSYNTRDTHKLVAETVQQMWKTNLGIDVAIQNYEWRVHVKNLQDHSFDVARMGGIGEYLYPTTFLEGLITGAPGNYPQWSNAEFDKLWEQANKEGDPVKRLAMYARMEEIIMEEMPDIPLYFYASRWMVKPYVKGMNLLSNHIYMLKYARIEK